MTTYWSVPQGRVLSEIIVFGTNVVTVTNIYFECIKVSGTLFLVMYMYARQDSYGWDFIPTIYYIKCRRRSAGKVLISRPVSQEYKSWKLLFLLHVWSVSAWTATNMNLYIKYWIWDYLSVANCLDIWSRTSQNTNMWRRMGYTTPVLSNHLIMSVTTASFRRLQDIVYVATWDVCEIMLCITLIMLWDCKLHIPNKIPIYLPTLHLDIVLIIVMEAFEPMSITMPAVYTQTGIRINSIFVLFQ